MIVALVAALLAAAPCGTASAPPIAARCLTAQAEEAEAALARLEASLPEAIDELAGQGIERAPAETAGWKAAAREAVRLWRAFGEARCDPTLLAYENGPSADSARATAACRLRVTRAALADLRLRYGEEPRGFGRKDVETVAKAATPSPEEAGPCAHAPPRDCDYCGMNACWAVRLKADDVQLNAAWHRALARIAAKPGLSAAERADWGIRLRKAQRLWLGWRDATCRLERLEAPNPNAHSVYALLEAPCIASETEARTAVLRRTYGP